MAKIGLQLYTVRERAKNDLLGTLHKIAECGYDGVEFDDGMLDRADPKQLRTIMDENGLNVIGLSVLMPELGRSLDPMIDYALTTGAEWLVMPWIDQPLRKTTDGYATIARALNKAGKRAAKFGLRFAYHIHGYEFELLGEKCGIDILLEILDPALVELQPDSYWLASAGVNCVDFINAHIDNAHIDRIGSFHLKDASSLSPMRDTEAGNGILKLEEVVKLGVTSGLTWFIVEQEKFTLPIFESIKVSRQNLSMFIQQAKSSNHQMAQ